MAFIGIPATPNETKEQASERCTTNLVNAFKEVAQSPNKPESVLDFLGPLLRHCGDNIKLVKITGTEKVRTTE